ncbi:hypothetical protein EC957_001384 [Mortierella hygrophila]|uniref:Uncharacterized protein n=1 Tax=Mortierella hygrophila TaxID=979708 RepID=A0A9P6F682_9FUNG|nr:hypothetical protein EC957_001384 [Mortierella hygrophila]
MGKTTLEISSAQLPFEGSVKMEGSGQMYFESLVGKWTLSNYTDTPGPFAPHEIMPLLHFLQEESMSQSLPAMKFHAALLHKEYDWLQSYNRPWELMESVEAMAVGYEKEQFQACLRIAFLQPGVIEAFISQKDCDVVVKHKLLTPERPTFGAREFNSMRL